MKPLELHIYDKHPDADAYRVGGFYSPYCLVSKDKRFRPGELAAEYWMASSRMNRMLGYRDSSALLEAQKDAEKMDVLDRFATLPHYDEADQ